MLGERHAWAAGVKDDQHNGLGSCHSSMEGVDCLGNRLSGSKTFLLSIVLSLKRELAGDDVRSVWHGMTVPFKFSVRRESDFQYCQLRLPRGVIFIRFAIPRRAGP